MKKTKKTESFSFLDINFVIKSILIWIWLILNTTLIKDK